MLQFSRYEKSYSGRLIVKADLHLKGKLYWLKGSNGSGKSTLLRSVAGIIPYKGNISVAGLDVRKQRQQYRLAVSYAEAEPLYPGFLTGRDILAFFTEVRKANVAQVKMLTEQLGIGSYLDSKIGTYSSGMAKKLSLALAFIGEPQLIMLDEPYITIDTEGLGQLHSLVRMHYANGAQIVITSHQDIKTDIGLQPALLEIHQSQLISRSNS